MQPSRDVCLQMAKLLTSFPTCNPPLSSTQQAGAVLPLPSSLIALMGQPPPPLPFRNPRRVSRHRSAQMVRSEYDELFEGDVVDVHVVYKTDSLDDLVKQYDSGLRDLEDLIDDYASQKSRDKKVKRKQVRSKRRRPGVAPR